MDPDHAVCSAKGCQADAVWDLQWNNPKIHTPERRKVWLACGEHREHLEEYLRVRAFYQDTVPVADLPRMELGARPGLPGLGGLPGRPGSR